MTRSARLGAVLVCVLAVLLGAGPAMADGPESISQYDTRIDIRADGSMAVSETIYYDFGFNQRHGIIRKIPAKFRYDDSRDRVYPIDDVAVTMDGQDIDVDLSSEDGYETFKIGDPDRTVTGRHTFVIQYTVRGALNGFPDHEELYWNAIGHEWSVPITAASATITGPADVQRVECFSGPSGSQLSCPTKSFTGRTATFAARNLGNGSGMSVVVAFPEGSVANTEPILEDRHDLAAAFRATPFTLIGGGALALLGIGGSLAAAWAIGRDRRYVGQIPGLAPAPGQSVEERRQSLFDKPPIAVEFAPPDNMRPGQVGTLVDGQANTLDVTATIIDFAVRKRLHITEVPREGMWSSQDWELTRTDDAHPADKPFASYEKSLFNALFTGRDRVRLSELKHTFATDLGRVKQELYRDMVGQGWYRRSPESTRTMYRGLAFLAIVAAIGVTVLLALVTQWALIGIGLVVAAIAFFAVSGRMPARTGQGSAMLARVRGFKLYLETAEAEQIKFEEREQIFSRYLPYAMVFGVADRWAGQFADIGSVQPDGTSGLYWYTGLQGWNMLYFSQSIGSFATTTSGTIASTPPPAVSGGSGFGGGGFSGGGGGGGGGSSW